MTNSLFSPIKPLLTSALASPRLRYLVAGGWNTVFGYITSVILYSLLSPRWHVVVISVLANILSISMSFISYKLLVFRTKGHWLNEYLRSYLVYGGMALVGTGLLWLFVDGIHLRFWLAQGIVIVSTVCISYLGHKHFTFNKNTISLFGKK